MIFMCIYIYVYVCVYIYLYYVPSDVMCYMYRAYLVSVCVCVHIRICTIDLLYPLFTYKDIVSVAPVQ